MTANSDDPCGCGCVDRLLSNVNESTLSGVTKSGDRGVGTELESWFAYGS